MVSGLQLQHTPEKKGLFDGLAAADEEPSPQRLMIRSKSTYVPPQINKDLLEGTDKLQERGILRQLLAHDFEEAREYIKQNFGAVDVSTELDALEFIQAIK